MIDRTFKDFKFKRTYIGGSKKREKEIFLEVQSDESKNRECDWVAYRNVNMQYFNDKLNVIFSWRYLFKNISYGFAIFTGILFFFYFYYLLNSKFLWIVGASFLISIICHLLYLWFLHKQEVELGNYNLALTIINGEIENLMRQKLKKNP